MGWLSHFRGSLRQWLLKLFLVKDTLVFYNLIFIINNINNNNNNNNLYSYIVTL